MGGKGWRREFFRKTRRERGAGLITGPGSTLQIDRADITAMTPSTVSLMPAGLDEQISRQELADLIEFLKNTRWGR